MTECFEQIPIDIYPLSKPIEEFLVDWPKNRMDRLVDSKFLNSKLLDYFNQRNIKVRENFIIWNWNIPGPKDPHTDGDWFSTKSKRLCGINWNFSDDTYVEFYSTEGGIPKYSYRGEYDFSTTWENTDKVIDVWNGTGPVIFNPQVPHNVKGNSNKRLSMTLRFYETYDSLRKKINV